MARSWWSRLRDGQGSCSARVRSRPLATAAGEKWIMGAACSPTCDLPDLRQIADYTKTSEGARVLGAFARCLFAMDFFTARCGPSAREVSAPKRMPRSSLLRAGVMPGSGFVLFSKAKAGQGEGVKVRAGKVKAPRYRWTRRQSSRSPSRTYAVDSEANIETASLLSQGTPSFQRVFLRYNQRHSSFRVDQAEQIT